jgi:hypothetical protein
MTTKKMKKNAKNLNNLNENDFDNQINIDDDYQMQRPGNNTQEDYLN